MRFRPLSNINLRQKLIVIIILFVLVPVATAGLFFYFSSEKYVSERKNAENQQVLLLLQNNVDQLLKSYEHQLMMIYQQTEVINRLGAEIDYALGDDLTVVDDSDYVDSINRFIRDFLLGKEDLDSIYLFSHHTDNVYFSDTKGPHIFLDKVKHHPEWIEKLSSSKGNTIWINTYELQPNRYNAQITHYFLMGMQIKNIYGRLEPLGYMMVNIKIDVLNKLMSGIQMSPNGFAMIIDADGHIIWHRNPQTLGSNKVIQIPFFKQLISGDGERITQKMNGETYQITSQQSDYNDWYYVSFVPQSDIDAELNNIKRFLATILIGSIVIFSLLAVLTTVHITRPLRRMVVAMNRLEKHNFNIQLDANSTDEIGILQQAFNRMSKKISQLIEEVRLVSTKEKESELKALQAQINPHFVYNSLDTINWMAIEKQEQDISRMIIALSDIMRYAIRPVNELVPFSEEIKWVKNYVYIQRNRFEDRFDLVFDIDERILDYQTLRLLLQPFVENAILHGLEHVESGGLINITIKINEELHHIVVDIEDNGSGMSEEKLLFIEEKRNTGIGIHNINDRLKLEYGAVYGVTLSSALGEGTKVTIIVPCIK